MRAWEAYHAFTVNDSPKSGALDSLGNCATCPVWVDPADKKTVIPCASCNNNADVTPLPGWWAWNSSLPQKAIKKGQLEPISVRPYSCCSLIFP